MFKGVPFLTRKGKRRILFRWPDDSTRCYLLTVRDEESDSPVTASCSGCLKLEKENKVPKKERRPLEVCKIRKGRKFREDPREFFHYVGCLPRVFDHTVNRYLTKNPVNAAGFFRDDSPSVEDKDSNCVESSHDVIERRTSDTTVVNETDSVVEELFPREYRTFVVRPKNVLLAFLYRLPENRAKCFRFLLSKKHSTASVFCSMCHCLSSRAIRRGDCTLWRRDIPFDTRTASTDIDPASIDHLPGCHPLDVIDAVDKHYLVDDSHAPSDTSRFHFEVFRKNDSYSMVVRLEEDPSMCYRFMFSRKYSRGIGFRCCECQNVGRRVYAGVMRSFGYVKSNRLNGYFVTNPYRNHFPECEPLLYSDVMKKYEHVDEETARIFIQGDMNDVPDTNTAMDSTEVASFLESEILTVAKNSGGVGRVSACTIGDGGMKASSVVTRTPKMFSRNFYAFTFARNEMTKSMDGQKLAIKFKRKLPTSLGEDVSTLRYKTEFPSSADMETLQERWDGRTLCVSVSEKL